MYLLSHNLSTISVFTFWVAVAVSAMMGNFDSPNLTFPPSGGRDNTISSNISSKLLLIWSFENLRIFTQYCSIIDSLISSYSFWLSWIFPSISITIFSLLQKKSAIYLPNGCCLLNFNQANCFHLKTSHIISSEGVWFFLSFKTTSFK